MKRRWTTAGLGLAVGISMALMQWQPARAQVEPLPPFPGIVPSTRFELSETVHLDRADSSVLADLERAKAYLADRQWDEAIETLCTVMEAADEKLMAVTERRYVSLRDYGHLQLAALPPEALALYRSRIDPLARQWYEDGVARRDRRLLANVVEQAFASSWGDDALLALGEMALESGDFAMARWLWERIVPAEPPPDTPPTWPGFPDTDLDLADVRARLALVSILEGSTARARDELEQFARLHADARGRLGGPEVNYAEALGTLLREAGAWPQPAPDPDWPTFAGNAWRNKTAPESADVGQVAWRISLPQIAGAPEPPNGANARRRGVAEDSHAPLSYHPVLVGHLVLINSRREILAVDVRTGQPAWEGAGASIYRSEFEGAAGAPTDPAHVLGMPRCTLTIHDGRLYGRMGTSVTSGPQQSVYNMRPGYLVCLDLAAEGRLAWKIQAEGGWAFEGSPVADGENVYVAMRSSDVRPEAHVACFDAQTGRRRWRRSVCAAETPARRSLFQNTHNLLTLSQQTIYYNTNLGAVAALSARDGQPLWVSLYPRARQGDLLNLAPHWHRDLNPCVYDHGRLLVAPADSPRIFALDAATGQILWQTGPEVEDAVHLLGTTEEHLIASGRKLYWIGLKEESAGRVKHVWPDGNEQPGYGRGLLAAGDVLFPTRQKIYLFDQQTARPKKVIDLVPLGATGGNLLAGGGRLLIATADELIALGPQRQPSREAPKELTLTSPASFPRFAWEPAKTGGP